VLEEVSSQPQKFKEEKSLRKKNIKNNFLDKMNEK
jgi:hypothetical protein